MPKINIDGVGSVNVDASFLSLSPEEQQKDVADITSTMQRQQNQQAAPAIAEGFGQGITYGTSDEIEGAIRALNLKIGGDQRPFSDIYGEQVQIPRDRQAADAQSQPAAFSGGELGGALMAPGGMGAIKGATAAERFGQGVVTGGLTAGAFGAGTAQGGIGNRLAAGAEAAPIGAALAGPLAAAAKPMSTGPSVGQNVASAANQEGIPIAKGVASGSSAVQTFTQGLRSAPIIGGYINKSMDATRQGIADAVSRTASDVVGMGGVPSRDMVGAAARGNIQAASDKMVADSSSAYDTLRGALTNGGDAPVAVPQDAKDILTNIIQQRQAAGVTGAGLTQGIEAPYALLNNPTGATFNGLQRARTTNAQGIRDWGRTPGQGFPQSDLKNVNDALTLAMSNAVQNTARGDPADAGALLNRANKQFGQVMDDTGQLSSTIARGSDEAVVNRIISYGNAKTGNAAQMGLLRNSMGDSEWRQVAGFTLDHLGDDGKGNFSSAIFNSNYGKLSDQAKNLMFGAGGTTTRDAIDRISTVSNQFAAADAARNTSGTAGALLGSVGLGLVGAYTYENPLDAVKSAAKIAGVGVPVAMMLTRPATASSMARWTQAYRTVIQGGGGAGLGTFRIASRNLANTIASQFGGDAGRLANSITGTVETQAQPAQGQ